MNCPEEQLSQVEQEGSEPQGSAAPTAEDGRRISSVTAMIGTSLSILRRPGAALRVATLIIALMVTGGLFSVPVLRLGFSFVTSTSPATSLTTVSAGTQDPNSTLEHLSKIDSFS